MFARATLCAALIFGSATYFPANAQSSSAQISEPQQADGLVPPAPVRPLIVPDVAYPIGSILGNEEGTSTANLILDAQGRVTFAQLVTSSGSSRLDQAGLQVARSLWQFQPARKAGDAIPSSVRVTLTWKLPLRAADDLVFDMVGISVSGRQVTPPSMIREAYRLTSADYPPASARAGELGEVAVKVFVLPDGSVGDAQLLDSTGHARLDERGLSLARERFKYRPGTVDGVPTAMSLNVMTAFVGIRQRNREIPQNAFFRFCHSRPILGTSINISPNVGQASEDGATSVQQWIHLTADGSVDDVLMATSRGWMHLSEALVADYTRAARQRPAVPNRPPSCWYNGSGVANPEPPKATSATELARRGFMYLSRGQLNEALSDLDQAVQLLPLDANVLNNRCYTLALLGRAQEALIDCNKSLERRGRAPATLDSRGFVHLLLANYADAISDYDAGLRGRRSANSLYGRGIAKIRLGQEAEGRADIAEAMKLDQNITARMTAFGFAP